MAPGAFYLYRPTNGLGVRRRILFYWLMSLGYAAPGYGVLWALLPGHRVVGTPYGMYLYPDAHPLAYISLCCGVFSPLAALATDAFRRGG